MTHAFFLTLLNMGLTAGYVALAVMAVRLVFRKAPRWISCALWGLVGARLVFPLRLKSVLSLIPSAQPIPPQIETAPVPSIQSGIGLINSTVNPLLSQAMAPDLSSSINPMQVAVEVGFWIWLAGVAVMLLYGLIATLRLTRKTKERIPMAQSTYWCDTIPSPFVFGLFRPKIYLPPHVREEDLPYVIAHEQAHIQRLDHIWKPLGFLLLTLYWFHPILWLSYGLFCRDIEYACDQKAIRSMDTAQIKAYSGALLRCSTARGFLTASPLAFGESGVKVRIQTLLHYKKPAFWVVLTALAVSLAVGVCFLTDPPSPKTTAYTQLTAESQLDGVSVAIANFDHEAVVPTLTIEWVNHTAKQLTLTEEFYIYRLEGDHRIDARLAPDQYVWNLTATLVNPRSAIHKDYLLYDMVLPAGTYQLETTFSHTDDIGRGEAPVYRAWVQFQLHEATSATMIGGTDQPTDIMVTAQSPLLFRVGNEADTAPFMDGTHVSQITTYLQDGKEMVRFDLNQSGTALFAKTTHQQQGNILSLWLDDTLMFSATVAIPITDGTFTFPRSAISNTHFNRLMSLNSGANTNPYFTATIDQVLPNSALVTVTDPGTSGLSGQVQIATNTLSQSDAPTLVPGQTIRVVFNGQVQEVFPPHIATVFAIYDWGEAEPASSVAQ